MPTTTTTTTTTTLPPTTSAVVNKKWTSSFAVEIGEPTDVTVAEPNGTDDPFVVTDASGDLDIEPTKASGRKNFSALLNETEAPVVQSGEADDSFDKPDGTGGGDIELMERLEASRAEGLIFQLNDTEATVGQSGKADDSFDKPDGTGGGDIEPTGGLEASGVEHLIIRLKCNETEAPIVQSGGEDDSFVKPDGTMDGDIEPTTETSDGDGLIVEQGKTEVPTFPPSGREPEGEEATNEPCVLNQICETNASVTETTRTVVGNKEPENVSRSNHKTN
jgi:hypothetical protein